MCLQTLSKKVKKSLKKLQPNFVVTIWYGCRLSLAGFGQQINTSTYRNHKEELIILICWENLRKHFEKILNIFKLLSFW